MSTTITEIGERLKMLIVYRAPSRMREILTTNNVFLQYPRDVPSTAQLTICHYLTEENADMRNTGPIYNEDKTMEKSPPLYVNLHFLITIAPKQNQEEESLILESVIRTLHKYPSIGQKDNTARITRCNLSIHEMNFLWQMLTNDRYRHSLAYIVSPVAIQTEEEIPVVKVKRRIVKVSKMIAFE